MKVNNKMFKAKTIIFLFYILSISLFSTVKSGIYYSVCTNDIIQVKQFIGAGVDLNKKDYDGDLALILAAQNNNLEMIKILLENGADINGRSKYNRTALMEVKNLDITEFLLNKGADIELKDGGGDNVFLLTSHLCLIDKALILLENNATIDSRNYLSQTALLKVFYNPIINEEKKLAYIKMLIDNKANINIRGNDFKTAYVLSNERGYETISNLLLQNGAVKESFVLSSKALVNALANKEYDRATRMINNGAEVNFLGSLDFSPLMTSIGNIEIMELLLSKGADVNLKNKMNITALTIAVINNDITSTEFLLNHNADVIIASTINNMTPLMFALQNKNDKIVNMLNRNVKDINILDAHGNTALLIAITVDSLNMKVIKKLVTDTNQINIFNNFGVSPLFKAVFLDHIELVDYLLKNGADVNLKNNDGLSVLEVASKMRDNSKKMKMINLLNNNAKLK